MVMASVEKSQPKTLKRGAGAAKATAGRAGKALRKEKQVKKQESTHHAGEIHDGESRCPHVRRTNKKVDHQTGCTEDGKSGG